MLPQEYFLVFSRMKILYWVYIIILLDQKNNQMQHSNFYLIFSHPVQD